MLPRENVKLRGMYLESWTISNLFLVEQKAQIANKPSVHPIQKGFYYSVQNCLSTPLPSYSEQNPQKTLYQTVLLVAAENMSLPKYSQQIPQIFHTSSVFLENYIIVLKAFSVTSLESRKSS